MRLNELIFLLFILLMFIPVAGNGQTTLEEIISDMTDPHEGRPHGVPAGWDWAINPRYGAVSPPEGWTAAIAWGQLYEWIDGNPAVNTRVQIRDMEMHYLSMSDLEWHELQNSVEVEGAAYVEDFAGDENKPADIRKESDGSISVTAGEGYNFHFWPKAGRINYPKNDVKGCYVTVRARLILDDPEGEDDRELARYVMGVGGDWWESLTAVWDNWTTNADMGIGRFRFVTSEWKSFNMITLPEDSVRKYPPPFQTGGPVSHTRELTGGTPEINIYPNPVSLKGSVYFSLIGHDIVKLTLWDLEGRLVQYLANQAYAPGSHSLTWDASQLHDGCYCMKFESGQRIELLKFMVLK